MLPIYVLDFYRDNLKKRTGEEPFNTAEGKDVNNDNFF
jgi:hypothetical protein